MADKPTYEELEQRVKELEKKTLEHKLAEEALRESEKNYRLLVENASDVIWTRDMNLNLTYLSPSIEKITGYRVEESMALPNSERMMPASMKLLTEIFEEELKLEAQGDADPSRDRTVEIEMICKDGSTVWLEITVRFIRNETGQAVGVLGISRDINECKQAQEALRESEERYRTVLEANPDPVVVYDIEGKVIYFNPAFTRVFGWTVEERISKKMDEFVPEEAWEETKVMIDKVLAGESFSGIETRRFTKEGKIIPISISGAIYRDPDNKPIGSVINLRNISAQKTLETQLQQALKMESIGTLTGGIAHDFNNILGIIIGNTELAMDDVPEWNPAHFNLKEIKTASMRAKNIVRQLLTFSRKTDQELKPIKIIPIIKDSLKFLRATIPTSIDIRQDIRATDDTVLADPTQIHQIMMNLCTNASHAVETGGTIEVGIENIVLDEDSAVLYPDLIPGNYVKVTVSDTGQGIAPEATGRIFDPYFTTKEVGKGTGMGLSVVHGIVKSHGGAIIVESELGKGTTFSVLFPVIEKQVDSEIEIDEKLPTGNERILFVDDEESMVYVGRYRLERLGYQVEAQTSPVQALKLFQANPDQFDLLITDMAMPRMTGDMLVKEILKIRPDMPTILCTGFSEKIDEERSKELGISAYIVKPFDRRDLAKLVRKVLDEK